MVGVIWTDEQIFIGTWDEFEWVFTQYVLEIVKVMKRSKLLNLE